MYDTKTGKLLWSGGATKRLKASDDIEKIIKTSVKNIFMRLPIKTQDKINPKKLASIPIEPVSQRMKKVMFA